MDNVMSIICKVQLDRLAAAKMRGSGHAITHAGKAGAGDGARAAGAGGVPLTLVKAGTRSYHECEALIAITGVT